MAMKSYATRSHSKSLENVGSDPDPRTDSEFALSVIEAFKDQEVIRGLQSAITIDYDKIVDLVVAHFEPRFKAMEKRLLDKEKEIEHLEVRIDELENRADDLEQYSRRSTIRITGVPEKPNEDIVQVTQQVLSKMSLSPTINRCHRVGPFPKTASTSTSSGSRSPSSSVAAPLSSPPAGNSSTPQPRSILCQFVTYADKAAVMTNRHLLRDQLTSVFINEDLTRKRSNLLYKCRALKRQNKIKDCWSFDGRITVKDNNSVIVPVRKLSDIQRFQSNN